MSLQALKIIESLPPENGFPCHEIGHDWKSIGGRGCPKHASHCSQTVYVCSRCKETDYGYFGGPAHKECFTECTYTEEDLSDALVINQPEERRDENI